MMILSVYVTLLRMFWDNPTLSILTLCLVRYRNPEESILTDDLEGNVSHLSLCITQKPFIVGLVAIDVTLYVL